jgi:hypothetical protein
MARLGTLAASEPTVSALDGDHCGTADVMAIGRENRSTVNNPDY